MKTGFIAGLLAATLSLVGIHSAPAAIALSSGSISEHVATSEQQAATLPHSVGRSQPTAKASSAPHLIASTPEYVTKAELLADIASLRASLLASSAATSPTFVPPQVAGNGNGAYYGGSPSPVVSVSSSNLSISLHASDIPSLPYLSLSGGTLAGNLVIPMTAVLSAPYASSTALTASGAGYFGTASTTNLVVSGLGSASTQCLTTNSAGVVSLTSCGSSGAFAYPFPSNATSTLIAFNSGLTGYASSTIGNGTQAGGLTISGGATTTGIAYFAGNVGIGTTSPGSILSVNGVANWTSATTTYYSTGGINLTAGCFSISGTCLPTAGTVLTQTTPTTGASFTASISGTTLTVTSISSGTIYPNQQVVGVGISTTTTILNDGTGTGGVGTYNLNQNDGSIASEAMTSNSADVFAGPYAGNATTAGTADTAFGFQAGTSLTVPASGANPQADTIFGYRAGASLTTGRETTLFGFEAGLSLTGDGSGIEDTLATAIGSFALHSCAHCTDDVALGQKAGAQILSGGEGLYIGTHSGGSQVSSTNDTYVGNWSGAMANGTTSFNTALGYNSALYLNGGTANTLLGYLAGAGTSGNNDTGLDNVYVGAYAGQANTSGQQNVYSGYQAGNVATNASGNTFLGYEAGWNMISGGNNTFIGNNAGHNMISSRDVCIGADACDSLSSTTQNAFVSGSAASGGAEKITDVYFGDGFSATSPVAYTIHGTAGSGSNIAGANVILAGGQGTGSSTGGSVIFQTAPAGSSGSSLNSLVEAARFVANGFFGIGTTTPSARLTVWGADTASNTVSFNVVNNASTTVFSVFDGGNAQLSGTLTQSSDRRLKTNINSLDGSSSLTEIAQLNPVSYNWLNTDMGAGAQMGFIAQDVQKIFPNLVSTTSPTTLTPDGTLGVNYIGFIAPLVKAVQELTQQLAGMAENIVSAHVTATVGDFDTLNFRQANGTQLCLGATCITEAQLENLLQQSGQPAPALQPASTSPTLDASSSSDDQPGASSTAN